MLDKFFCQAPGALFLGGERGGSARCGEGLSGTPFDPVPCPFAPILPPGVKRLLALLFVAGVVVAEEPSVSAIVSTVRFHPQGEPAAVGLCMLSRKEAPGWQALAKQDSEPLQTLPSSQFIGVPDWQPMIGSHISTPLHISPSSQVSGVPAWQTSSTHVSLPLHTLPSSQPPPQPGGGEGLAWAACAAINESATPNTTTLARDMTAPHSKSNAIRVTMQTHLIKCDPIRSQ